MAESSGNEFLPWFDVESSHSIRVAARSAIVYDVARNLDMSGSPLVRALFALRCMPAAGLRLQGLNRIGFKVLLDDPGREFVVGLIGRFWTLSGGLVDFEVAQFSKFDMPGYAKATWSFRMREDSGGTDVTTVTRVQCLDTASRRSFRRYWFFVRPFSGAIRREALRIVKKKAEAVARST